MSLARRARILLLRLRSVLRHRAVERELDEELQFHVDQQVALEVRRGVPADVARARALRALGFLGDLELRKESVRDTRRTRWITDLPRDVGLAVRALRGVPGFAVAVVVTLALGIGANTAMFTLLRGTLLRPLPHRDGERVVYLRQSAPGMQQPNVQFSVPEVADLRAGVRTLGALAEYSTAMPFTFVVGDGPPERVNVGLVSGNYFAVTGLDPVAGRLTTARDDGPAAAPVVVLSQQYWQERFGGDRGIVGRRVTINDKPATVIGVVERAPGWPRRADVFANMVTSPHHLSATMVTERAHRMTELFARLAPGATVAQAQEELSRLAAGMRAAHPASYPAAARFTMAVAPLRRALNERAALTFWSLMGAATFVLLIACANVANLTLMRGVGREREMQVRAALGAGSGQLRRLLVVENLVLALAGGALGVLVAVAGLRLLVAFAAQLSPRAAEIRVDGVVLAVGLLTSVLAALALSFVPSVGDGRALAAPLAAASRRATLGRGRQRVQRSLVVAQLAVCMVLLTGAGLLVRTLVRLQSVDTGVRAEGVLTMELPLDGALERAIMDQPGNVAHFERIRARVAALPGVDTVALAMIPPLRAGIVDFDVKAEGHVPAPDAPPPHAMLKTVDPHYFAAAGIPVLGGRTFGSTDRRGSARVALVNRSLARELFGDADPVGRRIAWTGEVLRFSPLSGDWRTIVGVVGDTRDQGIDGAPTPSLYEPFAQELVFGAALVVRTSGEPDALRPAVLRAIREVAPRQVVEDVVPLEAIRDETVAPRRLNAAFIASFGALALLIATVGIAGVLAFSVAARVPEIGIRMSLGATAGRVRGMVLGEGGVLLAAGLGLGAAGALVATRALRGLLFGVSPHDPVTLGAVALLLAAVGVVACWLPAARAARIAPAEALRAE